MFHARSDSYITPTKEQIKVALTRVRRAVELQKVIDKRLENKVIEVKSWFGFRRELMTMDEYIRKEGKNSFLPYYTLALALDYITPYERKICRFVMISPSIQTLEQWRDAERIYLTQADHNKLIYAITEEFE